jgi:hypothetical protein
VISRSRCASGGWRGWRGTSERSPSAASLRGKRFLEEKKGCIFLLEPVVLQVVRPSLPVRISSK